MPNPLNIEEKIKSRFYVPRYIKKKVKIMNCKHPGCTELFEGYPHAKFCEYHKNAKTRPVVEVQNEKTTVIIDFPYKEKTIIQRNCDCCNVIYEISTFPGIKQYSRFCPDHTNEYKRKFWRERHGQE